MRYSKDDNLRLEGVVASAMDAIITVDERLNIVLFNPAAEKMFGVQAADAMGQSIERFIPVRFRASHGAHIARFRKDGVTSRQMGALGAISGLRADGEEFPIEASISQVEIEGERLATVILRDITARKATEDALRESRRRMEGIVESAMDAIITVDEQQRILMFNPAAERMFGVAASEAMGEPIIRFVPERYRATHDTHIQRFREAGVTNRRMGALGAVSGLRANGEEFPVEASISQVEVGGERLATVILRDITERHLGEETRVLLAREVDHRAKNALAVAQSLIKLTKADTKEGYVRAVQGRIASLVRAHSLLSRGNWQGADFTQTIGDEIEIYAKPSQVTLSGPRIGLLAHAVQPVSLVFHELATNAVKHGALREAGGRVRVNWRLTSDGALDVDWIEEGGPPVTPPSLLGFGSTLLNQVVFRQLEGQLTNDWRPEGLHARLQLGPSTFGDRPARRAAIDRPAPGESPRPVTPRQRKRVLIVEDESLVAMELALDLTEAGWTVIGPAYSLREGLISLEADGDIDVAVLDVNLAGRAVYPLAVKLQAQGTPFVFCTGYEMVDPDGRFPDTPVVRKPVNTKLLEQELDALIVAGA